MKDDHVLSGLDPEELMARGMSSGTTTVAGASLKRWNADYLVTGKVLSVMTDQQR